MQTTALAAPTTTTGDRFAGFTHDETTLLRGLLAKHANELVAMHGARAHVGRCASEPERRADADLFELAVGLELEACQRLDVAAPPAVVFADVGDAIRAGDPALGTLLAAA